MKKFFPLLASGLLTLGCANPPKEVAINHVDSTQYPFLIDGGKKIVYQFGRMTADKGLKVYLDTITFEPEKFHLPDSLGHPLLQ